MASNFVEECLRELKMEVDNLKVRFDKMEATLKEFERKLDLLDESVDRLFQWR